MMATRFLALLLFAVLTLNLCAADVSEPKVFCYYDHKSYGRGSQGKMSQMELEPALTLCTHILYGYAGINHETNKMISLNESVDLDKGKGNYKAITQLKRVSPKIKILLSVGGGADPEVDGIYKYNKVLETPEARTAFITSALAILKNHNFDGLDLAWQFPVIKPKKVRGTLGSIWHGIKKTFGSSAVDENAQEHRDQFTKLVLETKNALKNEKMILTVSVLPNVNSSIYFDTNGIVSNIENLIVHAYNFVTPQRNPKEADYSSPIYELIDRNPELNMNYVVTSLIKGGFPANKIILGMPTFANTWKLDSESSISGVPPLHTDGPGATDEYTNVNGLMSYPEVCLQLKHVSNPSKKLRKVTDPGKKFGTYAYRIPDKNHDDGIWISYEDPDTAEIKAGFAKARGLAGVAIDDLSMDDFRGLCNLEKFPILRAAKNRF